MKRLYRVTVEQVLYVLADDEAEARDVAGYCEIDEDPVVFATEVDSESQIDHDWKNARPYTSETHKGYADGDPTCEQILAAIHATCSVRDCDTPVVPEGGDVCEAHVGNEAP